MLILLLLILMWLEIQENKSVIFLIDLVLFVCKLLTSFNVSF